MSEPLNPIGLNRIRAIIDLIEVTNDSNAELTLFVLGDYAAIEVRSKGLGVDKLRAIFGSNNVVESDNSYNVYNSGAVAP